MKIFLSVLLILVVNYSYAQITQLSPTKTYTVGEIPCGFEEEEDNLECDWEARLSYGIVGNRRIYTYEYRMKYGKFMEPKKLVKREIKFYATEAEIDFLYNQINDWNNNEDQNKPERLFFKLGEHTLEVDSMGGYYGGPRKQLYFTFEDREEDSENWGINGIRFDAYRLGGLFGK